MIKQKSIITCFKRVKDRISKVPLWGYLLLFAVFTYYSYDIKISADLTWHMNGALNIFLGRGYTFLDGMPILKKAPLWSGIIALSYWLFGVSVWSAFWAVRIFAILNPIAVYFLGKKMWNKWVGFSAGLLLLSSYSVNYWSYRHLDAVWPFFALLSILFLYSGFEEKKYRYFVIAGFFIGFSYLVKQAAVLLFLLPFFMWLFIYEYRKLRNIRGILLYFFCMLVVTTPWILYVFSHTGNFKEALLGPGGSTAGGAGFSMDIPLMIKNYFSGLWRYYSGYDKSLARNFIVAPLFLVSWLYMGFKAIRREKVAIILIICFLLLTPYTAHVGRFNFRVGQMIVFFLLSYLALAKFIFSFANYLSKKIKKVNNISKVQLRKIITTILVVSVILIQTFSEKDRDEGNLAFIKNSYFVRIFTSKGEREIHGKIDSSLSKAAGWLNNNAKDNKVMTFWGPDQRAIYFLTKGKIVAEQISFFQLRYQNRVEGEGHIEIRDVARDKFITDKKMPSLNDAIFVSSAGRKHNPRRISVRVLYESQLLKDIKRKKIKYIVVGKIHNFLSLYFLKSPFFEKVASFSNGEYQIFKAKNNLKPIPHGIYVTERTTSWLKDLKKVKPDIFLIIKNDVFIKKIGFSDAKIEKILNGQFGSDLIKVELFKVYE